MGRATRLLCYHYHNTYKLRPVSLLQGMWRQLRIRRSWWEGCNKNHPTNEVFKLIHSACEEAQSLFSIATSAVWTIPPTTPHSTTGLLPAVPIPHAMKDLCPQPRCSFEPTRVPPPKTTVRPPPPTSSRSSFLPLTARTWPRPIQAPLPLISDNDLGILRAAQEQALPP
jgi:hypothetical protein